MMRAFPVTPTIVRVATVMTLASAVTCQFLQQTDPTFPLLYFTIDSAVLMACVLAISLARPRSPTLDVVRGAATIGVVISGLIYATVIAPNSATGRRFNPGDDVFVRTAIVLVHGIGPVLAVADFLTHDYPKTSTRRTLASWCAWPLAYTIAIMFLAAVGIGHLPYAFLRTQTGGGILGVAGVIVALTAIATLLSYGLVRVHRKVRPTLRQFV